jgi:hypothetical protein
MNQMTPKNRIVDYVFSDVSFCVMFGAAALFVITTAISLMFFI